MIPPSQRVFPAASSVIANPATVESSALARLTISDDGVSGSATLDVGGALPVCGINSGNSLSLRGGSNPTGGKVALSENNVQISASGPSGNIVLASGKGAIIDAPQTTVGATGGLLAFRGLPVTAAPVSPTVPTQAVPAVSDPGYDAAFASWKSEVDNAIDDIRTALSSQGLSS